MTNHISTTKAMCGDIRSWTKDEKEEALKVIRWYIQWLRKEGDGGEVRHQIRECRLRAREIKATLVQ